jgi:hypothetical protein
MVTTPPGISILGIFFIKNGAKNSPITKNKAVQKTYFKYFCSTKVRTITITKQTINIIPLYIIKRF